MNQEVKDILNHRRKLTVLEYARLCGSNTTGCQEFNVTRSTFYDWKIAFEKEGKTGLLRKKTNRQKSSQKIKTKSCQLKSQSILGYPSILCCF